MSRDLPTDLARLEKLAFRRKARCGPLIEQFHRLESHISRSPQPGLLWNIYDWLLVPLSLWPMDFEGLATHLLATIQDSDNRKNGCGTADRPLLLWNSCEIVKPTVSSADLQFIENRKFSRSEICAALGVPEEIVSTTDHNKYDVMQGARLNFIENRVAPLCARLEASERRVINALDPSAIGWFDLDSLPIMQQAWRTRLAAAKIGFDMGIPFNELNRTFDLGFKRLPHGDICYLSKNLQSVGTLSPPPPGSKSASNGNGHGHGNGNPIARADSFFRKL